MIKELYLLKRAIALINKNYEMGDSDSKKELGIMIDTWELDSLVNSSKYDIDKEELPHIEVNIE